MMVRHLWAAVAFALGALGQTPAGALSCPEKITVAESVKSLPGWKASAGQFQHPFERVSIYNSDAEGREYDLAPDDQKQTGMRIVQTWNLKDYRSMSLFLRCRYHDTAAVLARDVPASLQTCTLTFTLDKNGTFVGKSSLNCR